jgi:hypothetical protein
MLSLDFLFFMQLQELDDAVMRAYADSQATKAIATACLADWRPPSAQQNRIGDPSAQ